MDSEIKIRVHISQVGSVNNPIVNILKDFFEAIDPNNYINVSTTGELMGCSSIDQMHDVMFKDIDVVIPIICESYRDDLYTMMELGYIYYMDSVVRSELSIVGLLKVNYEFEYLKENELISISTKSDIYYFLSQIVVALKSQRFDGVSHLDFSDNIENTMDVFSGLLCDNLLK